MWKHGTVIICGKTMKFCMKQYEEPSEYGINEGRISKLSITQDGKEVYSYDRGLDIPPLMKEAEEALEYILKNYN